MFLRNVVCYKSRAVSHFQKTTFLKRFCLSLHRLNLFQHLPLRSGKNHEKLNDDSSRPDRDSNRESPASQVQV
jgi:hypothetical protein